MIRELQQLLATVYDTHLAHDILDFLVTDTTELTALTRGDAGRDVDEKLIVVEQGDSLALALFLEQAVLDRLQLADPRRHLSRANLADFWTVIEGISHFNYLVWNAARDKPVTLMEMEMQAEVDKFVSTRLLLAGQPAADLGGPLLQRLFEEPDLAPGLDPAETGRYRDAARLAGRYCAYLQSRFPRASPGPDLLRELRGFYRLPQTAKVARIRAG